jgi:hypothetical protein
MKMYFIFLIVLPPAPRPRRRGRLDHNKKTARVYAPQSFWN